MLWFARASVGLAGFLGKILVAFRVGQYRGIVTRYFFSTVIGTVDTF